MLLIRNPGVVGHNTKIDTLLNQNIDPFCRPRPKVCIGSSKQRVSVPVYLFCSTSADDKIRVDSGPPLFAIANKNGEIEIPNVSNGTWTFQVWHESSEPITKISVDGKSMEWKRGRFDHAASSGTKDLGDIVISSELFD